MDSIKQDPSYRSTGRATRRRFMQSAATIGVGLGLPAGLVGCGHSYHHNHHKDKVLLDVTLIASQGEENGRPRRFYNCKTPGPTLRVRRGKKGGQLRIKLVNDFLPSNPDGSDACPANHNSFHGDNITNLHTHGLHVSPKCDKTGMFDADNVFIKLLPKGDDPYPPCRDRDPAPPCEGDDPFRHHSNQYVFDIPADHPPGTHWYHAHKHGSTAKQVSEGLAGALIIEDEYWDDMPSYIRNAPEDVLMIQQLPGEGLKLVRVDEFGGGDPEPRITMRPGEVRRWRFISSSPDPNAFISLQGGITDLEIFQIAFDGLTLPRRLAFVPSTGNAEPFDDPFAMAPGNRMDFIVRAPLDGAGSRLAISAGAFEGGEMAGVRALLAQSVLMTVEIDGDPVDDEWSEDDTLPGPGLEPISDADIDNIRTIEFSENFTINKTPFSGNVEQTMILNTVEEWTIDNVTDETHPFHIHVNPFFVTHIKGVELATDDPRRRWQDTLALPPNDQVKFLTRFADFTGKFVIHCHILWHEDLGMMQAVEVVEPTA